MTSTSFTFLARAILVKSEAYFDHYDVAFQEYFKGIETVEEITKQILEWLKDPITRRTLTSEQLAKLKSLTLDELIKQLEDRIKTQNRSPSRRQQMDRHRRHFTFRALRTKSCRYQNRRTRRWTSCHQSR